MHFHRQGSGEPLVLLHGIGHRHQAWRPVQDRLGDLDTIAVDSPGFGRSAPLPAGVRPDIAAYADAFEAFFRAQGLDRPHVAGNSMGGAIALELARRGAVASATALAPAGFWTPGERRYALSVLWPLAHMPRRLRGPVARLARTGGGRAALFGLLVARPADVPAQEAVDTLHDVFAAPAFAGALSTFSDFAFTAGEELDSARVTVAWGDKDKLLLFRKQSDRARAALPKARHLVLDAGHLPYTDAPDATADAIRTTVRGTG